MQNHAGIRPIIDLTGTITNVLPQVVREHWPQVGMTCTLEPV